MNIVLIAHDNKKIDILRWVRNNIEILKRHQLFATQSTGQLIRENISELELTLFKSGPLGGDQQVGAKIAEGEIHCVIFFWDPLYPHPHDVDVKALIRIAAVYNIPIACNERTADCMITSPLLDKK